MPHFFFNVRDGDKVIADIDGTGFPDLDAARAEARSILREFAIEALKHHQPVDRYQIEIKQKAGVVLAVITFSDISGIP